MQDQRAEHQLVEIMVVIEIQIKLMVVVFLVVVVAAEQLKLQIHPVAETQLLPLRKK